MRVHEQEARQSGHDVAVCCSVLQCVAACCSVLQCVAACGSVLQCVAACCSVLSERHVKVDMMWQCVAVCCSVLQCVAACCSVLQRVAVCCSLLQCVASHASDSAFFQKFAIPLLHRRFSFLKKQKNILKKTLETWQAFFGERKVLSLA